MKRKPRVLFFVTYTESEGDTKGTEEAAIPRGGAAPLLPRHGMVWAPRKTTDIALPPIYCFPRENPKYPSLHPRKVP